MEPIPLKIPPIPPFFPSLEPPNPSDILSPTLDNKLSKFFGFNIN